MKCCFENQKSGNKIGTYGSLLSFPIPVVVDLVVLFVESNSTSFSVYSIPFVFAINKYLRYQSFDTYRHSIYFIFSISSPFFVFIRRTRDSLPPQQAESGSSLLASFSRLLVFRKEKKCRRE